MATTKPTTVEQYIQGKPQEAREKLLEIRQILKSVAPDAKELIKWGSPVFEENRILFSYTAFRSHLNFMPTRKTLDHFREELVKYQTGMDTVQFPYDKPLPKALILKLAKHRAKDVRENDARWM